MHRRLLPWGNTEAEVQEQFGFVLNQLVMEEIGYEQYDQGDRVVWLHKNKEFPPIFVEEEARWVSLEDAIQAERLGNFLDTWTY